MIINALRNGIGNVLACAEQLTRPPKMRRDPEAQARVDAQAARLALYQYRGCPFCIKVRRELHRLNVDVELRDPSRNPQDRQDLLKQGGRVMVPCLRISENGQDRWMYESGDIVAYLRQQFEHSPAN